MDKTLCPFHFVQTSLLFSVNSGELAAGKKAPPPWPVILAAPKPQISWGVGICMMEPSNVYIEKVKKLYGPSDVL